MLLAAVVPLRSAGHAQPPARLRPEALEALPVRAADARIAYGDDSLQIGELRLPEGTGPFPVAVVIHGGCWLARIGSYQPTLRYVAPLAEALREAGVATWNIEYRAVGHPGGGWPGSFLDIARAVDHVRALSRRFPLDTSRVISVGHSAGGHFALWAAGRHRLEPGGPLTTPAPVRLAGAVAVGGPGDMLDFAGYDASICGERITARLFGASDTLPAALAEPARHASPAELLPLGVPHVLVVGEDDRVVPPASARAYVARARRAGDRASYVPVPGAGHFEPLAPAHEAWRPVLEEVLRLLR